MTEQQLALSAAAFIIFWLWTLEDSTHSLAAYLVRSVVILAYQFWVMGYDSNYISLAEWIANFMIWSHWFSMVTVFIFPDPRFQKKRTHD